MDSFDIVRKRALERQGSESALNAAIAQYAMPIANVSAVSDEHILAEFSRRIFQTGLNWKVIENKWDGFEEAFHGFDLGRNALMSDEDFDNHLSNAGIVRHGAKILSVRDNAVFLGDLAKEHGSAGAFFESWPSTDIVGLWDVMKKRGSRLGGTTGQYALRALGKDSFMLTKSVAAGLKAAGVVDGPVTSKKAQKQAQDAFNQWREETGDSFANMSRTVALSVPD